MKAKTTPVALPVVADRPLSKLTMLLGLAEIVLVIATVVVLWKHPSQFRDARNILLVAWLTIIITSATTMSGRTP